VKQQREGNREKRVSWVGEGYYRRIQECTQLGKGGGGGPETLRGGGKVVQKRRSDTGHERGAPFSGRKESRNLSPPEGALRLT